MLSLRRLASQGLHVRTSRGAVRARVPRTATSAANQQSYTQQSFFRSIWTGVPSSRSKKLPFSEARRPIKNLESEKEQRKGSIRLTRAQHTQLVSLVARSRASFLKHAKESRRRWSEQNHGSRGYHWMPLGDEGELSKEYLWTYSTTILAAVLFGACSSLLAVAICEEEDGDSSRSSAALDTLNIINQHIIQAEEDAQTKRRGDANTPEKSKFGWWDLIAEEVPLFILAVVLALSSSLVGLALPKLGGSVIDITRTGDTSQMVQLALKMAGSLAVQAVLHFGFYSVLSIAAERMCARLRKRLYQAMIEQDREFFDSTNTGELMSRLSSDVVEIRTAVKHTISMGIKSVSTLVGGVVTMFMISPKLTMLVGLVVPLTVLIGSVYARWLRKLSRQSNDVQAKSNAVGTEALSNVSTVQAFVHEEQEVARYGKIVDHAAYLGQKFGVAIGMFQGLSIMALNGTVLGVLCLGGYLVGASEMSTGNVASFVTTAYSVQHSLGQLSMLGSQLMRGVAASERIFEVIDTIAPINSGGGYALDHIIGNISLKGVAFRYPTRKQAKVLDNVTLNLEAGKVLALVGSSGSGKSTIGKLLLRFYEVEKGSIELDGIDIQTLDPHWLRSQVGVVDQEPILFSGTIAENISYGRPHASMKEIEKAAKIANCHDFITNFPDGYNTVVGERGVATSGGQKQRIAIARAMLKNPRILILDEATSALDAESEKLVQSALNNLMADRTVLVIAHRLSTIKNADKIIVMDRGHVVESGTHQELVEKNGHYAKLVQKQFTDDDGQLTDQERTHTVL